MPAWQVLQHAGIQGVQGMPPSGLLGALLGRLLPAPHASSPAGASRLTMRWPCAPYVQTCRATWSTFSPFSPPPPSHLPLALRLPLRADLRGRHLLHWPGLHVHRLPCWLCSARRQRFLQPMVSSTAGCMRRGKHGCPPCMARGVGRHWHAAGRHTYAAPPFLPPAASLARTPLIPSQSLARRAPVGTSVPPVP